MIVSDRQMITLDILILIIIGIGAILGLKRGFVCQLTSLLGLIVGLLAARALYIKVGDWILPTIGTSVTVARVLAFFMIWIVVPLLFSLVASFMTKVLKTIHLNWINRWLGGILGTVKYMLIVGLLVHIIQFVDSDNHLIPQTTKEQSMLYYPMQDFTGIFIPTIKEVTEQIRLETNKII